MTSFSAIIDQYAHYDLDGDNINELEASLLPFETPADSVDPSKKLVVVLVNSQLFDNISNSSYTADDLTYRLLRFKYDLERENRQARCVRVAPYAVPLNSPPKGGKTLLAIRELLKTIRASFPNLEGVILVGAFPDARVTRLQPEQHITNNPDGTKNEWYCEGGFVFANAVWDIVLADLEGNWSNIYRESLFLEKHEFHVVNNQVSQSGSKVTLMNPRIEITHSPGQQPAMLYDTFFVQDCNYGITILHGGATRVEFELTDDNPEVSQQNRTMPNPIATPTLCVSRINSRRVAVQPPDLRLLDADGNPQRTSNAPPISMSVEDWKRDQALERTLLIDYFDRNHAFRCGKFSRLEFGISLLESGGLGTGAAHEGLDGLGLPSSEVTDATLLDFIRWLKSPSTFRALSSHADCCSTFLKEENDTQAALAESEAGGHPWRWIEEGGQYIPSFKGHSKADLHVYRTLWEDGQLSGVPPSLSLHVGCSAISLIHCDEFFNDAILGAFQNVESLLFFGNQLAICGHNCWWNRGPVGFGRGMAASGAAVFGDGWKQFFDEWLRNPNLKLQGSENKRCYEWSVVGDWTLAKYYPALTSKADLVIADLKAPAQVKAGRFVEYAVTVKNVGTEPAGPSAVAIVFIRMTTGFRGVTLYRYISALDPGESKTVSLLHALTTTNRWTGAKYLVMAAADALADTPESNEFNNTNSVMVTVSPAPFPATL